MRFIQSLRLTVFFNQIDHHKNPISATAVIGANALSEIGASFVDFFGGRSRNYENKLQELYKSVVESLKQNARSLRADAIIGFSVNIDELSGSVIPSKIKREVLRLNVGGDCH